MSAFTHSAELKDLSNIDDENIDTVFNCSNNKKSACKTTINNATSSPTEHVKTPLATNNNTINHQPIKSSPIIDLDISENSEYVILTNINPILSPVHPTNNSLVVLDESSQNDSNANNNSAIEEVTESEEQRLEREQRESELLAWEMMREESNEIYQMQMQFMRENMNEMSEEDILALSEAINESGRPDLLAPAIPNPNEEVSEGEEEEEDDDDDEDNPDNWDYERLLQIGQQIGDVKTERWRLRATNVIESLSTAVYGIYCSETDQSGENQYVEKETETETEEVSSCKRSKTSQRVVDYRCAICMDPFEQSDVIAILPCKHYFHKEPCTKGWLADHNSCPNCKSKVSATP